MADASAIERLSSSKKVKAGDHPDVIMHGFNDKPVNNFMVPLTAEFMRTEALGTQPTSSSASQLAVGNLSLVQQIQFVCEKIASKLKKDVDSLGRAKNIVSYLRTLKSLISDEQNVSFIESQLFTANIFGYLMVSGSKLLKFGLLTEETLRCILPVLRQKSTGKIKLLHQLIHHGAVVFSLSALRHFENEVSIKTQALELLTSSIDAVVASNATTDENYPKLLIHDLTHQLIVNGCTTTLPALFTYYTESENDVCIRRVMRCILFLLSYSPNDLMLTIIGVNSWCCMRSLVEVMRGNASAMSKVQSIELLIGLLGCSTKVADKLLQFCGVNGIDKLNELIAENISSIKVQDLWCKKAAITIKSVVITHAESMKVVFEKLLRAINWIQKFSIPDMNVKANSEIVSNVIDQSSDQQRLQDYRYSYWPETSVSKLKSKYTLAERIKASPLNQSELSGGLLMPQFPVAEKQSAEPLESGKKRKEAVEKYRKKKKEDELRAIEEFRAIEKPVYKPKPRPPPPVVSVDPKIAENVKILAVPLGQSKIVTKVAERLFESNDVRVTGVVPSAIDSLSYVERLQVMIMQLRKDDDKEDEKS